MSEVKLLKQPFCMCDVKHTPPFLAPYSFVISMPHKLTLICPQDDAPPHITISSTCSCFVIEEDDKLSTMKATSSFVDILANADIDSTVMVVENSSYVFVDTDDAMNAVMILTNTGYDVTYSDFY